MESTNAKKYVSLSKLSIFLDNCKSIFATHTHTISQVENLQSVLDNKQDAGSGGDDFLEKSVYDADGEIENAGGIANYIDNKLTLSRGPYIIAESCTFNISTLGLKVGDIINVVCVGAGGGAGYTDRYGSYQMTTYGYGYGGGQNGGPKTPSYFSTAAGGSGYSNKASITLTSETVAVTIGAPGAYATDSSSYGGTGGTTSFGSYLSAAGGGGGKGQYGANSNTESNVGGSGAVNGQYRGSAYTYALGGAGVINDGNFSMRTGVAGDVQCGSGAVFIWW